MICWTLWLFITFWGISSFVSWKFNLKKEFWFQRKDRISEKLRWQARLWNFRCKDFKMWKCCQNTNLLLQKEHVGKEIEQYKWTRYKVLWKQNIRSNLKKTWSRKQSVLDYSIVHALIIVNVVNTVNIVHLNAWNMQVHCCTPSLCYLDGETEHHQQDDHHRNPNPNTNLVGDYSW